MRSRWSLARSGLLAASLLTAVLTPIGVTASASEQAPTRAADPCASNPRCVEGRPADVTGDRVADRIGYVVQNSGSLVDAGTAARVRIVVTTPAGERLSRTYAGRGRLAGTYGAAPVDGVAGAEIVLLLRRHGGIGVVTVLTVRDGSLVVEPGPWQLLSTREQGQGITQKTPPFGPRASLQTCSYQLLPTGRVALTTKALDWTAGRWFGGGDTFTTSVGSRKEVPRGCGHWSVPGMTLQPLTATASR